jgi:hypothetical protein
VLNVSKSLQTTLAAGAHLADGITIVLKKEQEKNVKIQNID